MHGGINTADRYRECIDCGDPRGFDLILKKCTITSCINYFGARSQNWVRDGVPPVPPRPRGRAANPTAEYFIGNRRVAGFVSADPRPPSTREVVEAEQAVLAAVRALNWMGLPEDDRLFDLYDASERLNTLLARNSASNSDAFSRQHDR